MLLQGRLNPASIGVERNKNMEFLNAWTAVFLFAWLLCVVSFFVHANYKGWLEWEIFSSLSKPRIYFLLRLFRAFTLLFISVSITAFLYYETDVFVKKKIPEFKIQLTREQYQKELSERSRIIGDKIKYARGERAKVLERQKSLLDEELIDVDKAFAEHITVLAAHVRSLKRLYKQAPADLLDRARQAMAVGNLMDADIFLETLENSAGLDAGAAGRLAWARGVLAEHAGDFPNAYKHYSRAAYFMPDEPKLDRRSGWLAFNMGDYKASKSHYEAALADDIRRHGERHPEVAGDYRNLGWLASKMENYGEAYANYERALFIDSEAYGNDHSQVAEDRMDLGWALGHLGEYRKALPYLEQALISNQKNNDKDNSETVRNYALLGDAWAELEDYRKSVMYYERALNAALNVYGEDHDKAAYYCEQLGWLWENLAEHGKAKVYFERALAVYRKRHPQDESKITRVRSNLKIVQENQRRGVKAPK